MSSTDRPLWKWILLALGPGLVADVLSVIVTLTQSSRNPILVTLGSAAMVGTMAMPLVMLVYLIVLGAVYVETPHAKPKNLFLFVVMYGFLNLFLWGAGCTLTLSTFSVH